ncbi:TPA: hypothetical protein R1942_000359 [Staphylococcus delphini]|nr:hypothetical protein [Escherichia coli]HEC2144646.1 hypothetical protein [Staphylococcus delphini]HEC2148459.1 hypothetical protein [Staphylococcus delphini]HEC2186854.1 hypothetical protein [Staphylococcus delphini]HEC2198061.1 hypothetical protein [Staphylococcus delphini]
MKTLKILTTLFVVKVVIYSAKQLYLANESAVIHISAIPKNEKAIVYACKSLGLSKIETFALINKAGKLQEDK